MVALFRSLGSRHILSLPFAFLGYVRLLTHGVGCLLGGDSLSAGPSLLTPSWSPLYSMGTFRLPCWTGGTVGSVLMSYSPFMSPMQSKLLGNKAWRFLVLSMVTDPGGGGLLDGCSVTGCVFFLDLGSEMTWVASSAGIMYWGLRLLTLFTMVLKCLF